MKSVKTFFLSVFLIMCAYTLAHAAACGTVTYVEGRVDILPSGSEKWVPVISGSSIGVGDSIRTKSNSKAEVTFNDKTIVRIAQNSKVNVKEYQLDDKGNRKSANIMIERGKARSIISKMKDAAEFKLCTPNSCGTVKGSDIFTFYQSGNSGMLVAEGALAVFNPARPEAVVNIPAGSAALVPLEDAPKGPRKYLEMEEKSHAEDTNIPETLSTRKGASVIKGTITKFTGDIKVTTKGSDTAHAARQGEVVSEGDKIVTGPNSIVEIVLDNGNALYLKQNTDITILKLVIDAKTGEFENIFGTEKGDVKARIEGLKGKSKFEVKTPTAICGARGTIMLVHVAPDGATNSFFEGGNGYTTNLISGQTMDVGAGGGASTDGGGGVTGSEPPSGDDRAEMGDGFDPDGGTGDSTEGEGGEGLGDAGLGGGATSMVSDAVDTADAGTGDTIDAGDVVDVPITEADGSILEDEIESENEATYGTIMGSISYSTTIVGDDPVLQSDGSLYDIKLIGPNLNDPNDLGDLWLNGSASIAIEGTRSVGGASPYYVWTTEDIYGTSGDGAYYIAMGGANDGVDMRGIGVGLYIHDTYIEGVFNRNAGVIFGSFGGTDEEAFSLDGIENFYLAQKISDTAYPISPAELSSHIKNDTRLEGRGYYEESVASTPVMNIKTIVTDGFAARIDAGPSYDDWGIWGACIAGTYYSSSALYPVEGSQELEIAGISKNNENGKRDGAWLQVLSTSWDNTTTNKIDGTSEGVTLSLSEEWFNGTPSIKVIGGSIQNGAVVGNYIDADGEGNGAWQAVSCGEWVDVPDYDGVPMATLMTDIASAQAGGGFSGLNPNLLITVAESVGTMSLAATPTNNITSVNMDMRCYEAIANSNNGIWAATITGGVYSAAPMLNNTPINIRSVDLGSSCNLIFTQWDVPTGVWRADVADGQTSGSRNFSGNAAGTIDTSTTFSGAAVGTWTQDPPNSVDVGGGPN